MTTVPETPLPPDDGAADGKPGRQRREYMLSLEKGLAVLACFSRDHPEMSLSEITEMTGLGPAVARRCLLTLLHLGYIGKHDRLYVLRPRVMALASSYLEAMRVEEAFRPALQRLSDETGDSASLSVLVDDDIAFLVYVSTAATIHHEVGVGKRCPAYVTALGRALLAQFPPDELEEYLKTLRIKRYTERTVRSLDELRLALDRVRKAGYACVEGEFAPHIVSLAVPILDPQGLPVASINCTTVVRRANEAAMIETRLPLLRQAAWEIERQLRRIPSLAHSIRPS